ncbi:hypothetical protein A3K89_17510 [Rhodococcoides kyotonense]|uniref:CopC domain-containing protein n=2 Tax=Mycobacteriales TaxID=85007 RepID=A0A177YKZ4_9NOCA|nr:hypothetical protein A3K89_17510 [Rhodococcus kyotonensis]
MMCGAALVGASPAAAHSELVSSDPPADVTLEFAPIGVGLVFNQNINESFATITLVGPDEQQWSQGSTTVDGPDVTISVKDGLPNGDYTVGYRVTSADGHPITGSYGFSVDVAATTAVDQNAASPESSAAGAVTTTTPSSVPAYDPADPSASEGERPPKQNTMMLLSIVAIAVLLLGAIALALVFRAKNKQ